MKKILYSFIAAGVASLAMVSCNKTEIEAPNQEPTIHLQVTANLDTKTEVVDRVTGNGYDIQWTAGDQLGVFEVVDGTVQGKQSSDALTAGGETMTFDFSLPAVAGSAYDYTFVYPADAVSKGGSTEAPIYRLSIADKQTFPANSFDKNADVLVSEHKTLSAQPSTLTLNFARMGATARMVLKGVSSSEIIKTVKFSTTEGNIAGYKKYNPQSGVIDADGQGVYSGSKEIELTPEATDLALNGDVVVWFRLYDITLTSNFTVFVKTDAAEYTKAVDLATAGKSLEFKNGALTKFTVDLSTANRIDTSTGKTYNLVNSLSDVVDGATYLIVAENEGDYYALGQQNTNNRAAAAVTENNGVVTVANAATVYPVIVEAVTDGYTLKDTSSNLYLYASSTSSNQLKSTDDPTDAKAVWTIEITSGVAHITNVGNTSRGVMRFNPNNGSPLFAAYGSTSTTGTADLALYVDPDSLVPDSREAVTLSFSPASPVAITLGDAFTEPTLTVDPTAAASSVVYSVETTPDGCASIDASTGELTITAAGTITVKAEIPDGDTNYKPASASYTLTVATPVTIQDVTIAQFIEAAESSEIWYRLTGVISDITNTTYGNFTLTDVTGSVTVYGLTATQQDSNDKSFASLNLEEGYTVTIIAHRSSYNSNPQAGGAYYESHTIAPTLEVSSSNLVFAATGESKTVTATANHFNGTVTITAVSDNAQFTTSVSGTTVTITAAENQTNASITGKVTVTATDGNDTKTAEIDLTQGAPVAAASDGDVLWQEDFTDYGTTMPSTATGAHVYGGGTVTYSLTNGGSTTKLYAESSAGGSSPELLISKTNGAFTISGIPTGSATAMTLTFKANYGDRCDVSSSTAGITVGTSSVANGVVTTVITATSGVTSFDLVITNTNSSNVRVDNFVLIVGAPTVTLDSISVSGQTTAFTKDDTFSFGGTVTAHYSDGSSADVTSSATFTGYNMSTTGSQTVTVSYTEGEVTKTTTYTITVSEASSGSTSVTYDFTGSDWSVSNGTLSNGTVSFTGEGGKNFKMNSGYFILGQSGAYITFPTYSNAVSKIEVTGRSGASGSVKQNIFVGDTAVSTETTGATGTNTYIIASGYQAAGTTYTLKVTSAHNTQITKIEVFFE